MIVFWLLYVKIIEIFSKKKLNIFIVIKNLNQLNHPLQAQIKCIKSVIQLLPTINKLILKKLMGLLNLVDKNNKFNKMTANNLAIIFSPRYEVLEN